MLPALWELLGWSSDPPPSQIIDDAPEPQLIMDALASAHTRNRSFLSYAATFHLSPETAQASQSLDQPARPFFTADNCYSDLEDETAPCPIPEPVEDDIIWSDSSWQKGGLLGHGSFGTVFLGLNLHTGELLAVKQVNLGEDFASHQDVILFQEEINLLKSLKHENIVRYLGSCVSGNSLQIFLEYVSGGSICSVLHRFGKMNEKIIQIYTKQILDGLSYLHQCRIIHRDIKGANILLDNKGVIKLADFGASKKLEGLVPQTGHSLKGTVYWMAPEVLKQSSHGRQADIWSLGCTVIEMATAAPPWSGEYPDQVSALFNIAINNTHPPLPEGLSPLANDFLLQCLRRDPSKRPSAHALLKHPFLNPSSPLYTFPVPDPWVREP